MKSILRRAKDWSPYLLAELLLPGGTAIALALWAYRHARAKQLVNATIDDASGRAGA
jgi:hypothetical protein